MRFRKLLFTFSLLLTTLLTYAQVTTSSITGVVTDSKGQGLIGATVKATHTPTGTVYGTTTRNGGEFTIPNVRVGGPYKVEVSFISYGTETFNDIFLKLGEPLKINVKLSEGATNLKEISITATKNIAQGNGGTALNVSRTQMDNIPTVNRSVQDFVKLSPQASVSTNGKDGSPMGISFGGQSNKYNQFAVDGAVTNDVFGLSASGTNGGQAGANPISIETIDQLQIVLNPYDVKQSGFTGGGINAITKSGTNQFHGAAYLYYQNQGMVGKAPDSTRSSYGTFNNKIFGASVGGPIIKNKLFFFINAERSKRVNPIDFNPGTGSSNVTVDELQNVYNHVKTKYGVDLGGFTDQQREKPATTLFGRIDWNINSVHKLTFRHNYLNASDLVYSRTNSAAAYYNNYYTFPSISNSSVVELNSNFSNKLSNELRVGYNNVKDRRKYLGSPFPNVIINDNGRTINLGSEFSSGANSLNQSIWTITDNLTMYHGKHTITVGANAEIYKIKNTFIQGAFGAYVFDSIAGFVNDLKPKQYQINYTTADSTLRDGIGFKAAQIGIYAQDEWNIRRNFTLTYGVRIDIPIFPTTPPNNESFSKNPNFAGYSTTTIPKSTPLIAPRVGFTWDVTNDGKTIIRGGVGIFTGRVPFVWISNQYTNTGNIYTNVNLSGNGLPNSFRFNYDGNSPFYGQYSAANLSAMGANVGSKPSNINLSDKSFKFPQMFKTNLAVERKLPWGMTATLEGNFTKTVNNAIWNNLNVTATGDSVSLGGGVKRPMWKKKDPNAGDQILLLQNTSDGYTYNISGELTKVTKNGLFFKVGYSYGDAYSVNDGTSSTAASNWRFGPNINGLNNLDMGRSNYSMGSRVLAVVSKAFTYGKAKQFRTSVTLFYNGQSGVPYSWVYFNSVDPTGDDLGSNGNNDLIYIPKASEVSTMRFDPISQKNSAGAVIYTRSEAEQRTDLERLISNDSYLDKHRGENAKKNASRTPFENIFDFKVAQVLPIYKNHKIELTFDILNVGNLLNSDWGKTYFISNNAATPLTYRKADVNGPVFQYDRRRVVNGFGDEKPYAINNFTARWRGQVGVRYSF
ncbi:TonB-dependent receptor-like protein [Chitinophaga niastensis]|uniref:TonB-dependent receptor-like protein n=1 Tax=Chitinophaga niastensis TaxID=536980 RepID=A0A2P8HJS6_CHINA|nr:carboxypeptidase regulatory-like domain-containing protein [Chitinophaga niastensis]PSL46466.1 TonB-dependent receptor-like protein [Chitinophaga niastensis]